MLTYLCSHQDTLTWGFIQLNISIIAACMPVLRPIFHFLADNLTSRKRTGSKVTPNSGYIRQTTSTTTSSRHEAGDQSQHDLELGNFPLKIIESRAESSCTNRTRVTTRDKKLYIASRGGQEPQENIFAIQGSRSIVRTTHFTVK